jgi:hypothetical protein
MSFLLCCGAFHANPEMRVRAVVFHRETFGFELAEYSTERKAK